MVGSDACLSKQTAPTIISCSWIELNWIDLNWIQMHWIERKCVQFSWVQLNWIQLNWNIKLISLSSIIAVFAVYKFIVFTGQFSYAKTLWFGCWASAKPAQSTIFSGAQNSKFQKQVSKSLQFSENAGQISSLTNEKLIFQAEHPIYTRQIAESVARRRGTTWTSPTWSGTWTPGAGATRSRARRPAGKAPTEDGRALKWIEFSF